MSERWRGIVIGAWIGLLVSAGIQCMTMPSDFNVTVNFSDEDRDRVDTLNVNLEHLSNSADETLELFAIPADNTPTEGD